MKLRSGNKEASDEELDQIMDKVKHLQIKKDTLMNEKL